MSDEIVLGVDVGGSGIKGALVDTTQGILITERVRFKTPKPATPEAVADTFYKLVETHDWIGKPIGCGFPAILAQGVAKSAANIDKSWIGVNVEKLFSEQSKGKVKVVNDADAAGIAELEGGAGKDRKGVTILLTIGTGIGSALFLDGQLVPNTELGHVKFKGGIAEAYTADSARKRLDLSWDEWGKRFNQYLHHIERLFSPDLIIIGGGASKKIDKFKKHIDIEAEVITAKYRNNAGIIGAAYYALHQ